MIVYAPAGVPAFLGVLLELPPHVAIHTVVRPNMRISPRKRRPRRRIEPTVNTTPSIAGNRVAKNIPLRRSIGLCSFAVGAVVVMVKLDVVRPLTFTAPTGPVHVDSGAGSVQVYVTCELNPFVGLSVMFAVPVPPAVT